jgi:hypothetical protein
MNRVLWVVQGLLAALFLFTGVFKLVVPIDTLTAQTALPGLFLRFVAVCEILGALGLIVPGLLRIRTGLTPVAAAGLIIIMIGATVTTAVEQSVGMALFPFVVGTLLAWVAYGRWRLAPLRPVEA